MKPVTGMYDGTINLKISNPSIMVLQVLSTSHTLDEISNLRGGNLGQQKHKTQKN